ncbi:MAG: tetratricopeptide repeat protein [Sedimentisphaerales bacterium]|nr:tetratricopeptide repeat protein [Sedimentisphaerales bacterium]
MQKPVRNLIVGLIAVAAAVVAGLLALPARQTDVAEIREALGGATPRDRLTIEYPLDETLFPPEIPSPSFRWKDGDPRSDLWLVTIEFADGAGRIDCLADRSPWRPEVSVWEAIKQRSLEKPATVTIVGVNRRSLSEILSRARVTIKTSADEVGAPLFYREVNLPFVDAVRDPSNIRWRFGTISSPQIPPVVLEKLPVCGNCHSFSADGAVLGMDIDYANDKGSYAVAGVERQITLDRSKIISWSDYKRNEGDATYGLLSQVSPDGRFVVSTVKDESVFVPKPGLEFSQLFFPVKGILCIYDRQTGAFQSLPGANDPNLVQSNPTWSPDGKYIIFAATQAHRLKRASGSRGLLLTPEECREFLEEGKPFKFDLYRIPFNDGRGGKAVPIRGASFNGMSNYFARYSPDGKWIVFCKAQNYMLLQPDSELYIIPSEGGEPRRLRANTKRMNSWHSFSPNGRWLVFSGKPDSAYTRLFLTHIDENGESTPAVALDHLTSRDRAANIPEFVNLEATAIQRIKEKFVDDLSYVRAAWEYLRAGDYSNAKVQCRKALELNPESARAYYYLGLAMFGRNRHDEAIQYLSEAVQRDPEKGEIHTNLGAAFVAKGMLDEAVSHLQKALQIDPNDVSAHSNLGVAMLCRGDKPEAIKHLSRAAQLKGDDCEIQYDLARVLEEQGDLDKAVEHYLSTVRLKPDHAMAHARLGMALCARGAVNEGLPHLSTAVDLDPANATVRYNLAITLARLRRHDQAIAQWRQILQREPRDAGVLSYMAVSYAETGRFDEAVKTLEEALGIAQSDGDEKLAGQITRQIARYRQNQSSGNPPSLPGDK